MLTRQYTWRGLFLLLSTAAAAQPKPPLVVDIFSNATTFPTQPGQLFAPIHPGITVGTKFSYLKKPSNYYMYQTAKLGFFHHRFVQSGLMAYTEFHYSYRMKWTDFGINIGGGLVNSFPATQIFKLENGGYVRKTNWGRLAMLGSASIEVGQQFTREGKSAIRVFANYQFWLQTPFVNQYVPVLPNTALHLGVGIPVFKPSKPKE